MKNFIVFVAWMVKLSCVLVMSHLKASDEGITSLPAMEEALRALISDDVVQVEKVHVSSWSTNAYYYQFVPTSSQCSSGFIFYPGALVEAESYAPTLRQLALQGLCVFLVKMPFDLVTFGQNRAETIINTFETIKTWLIGGHSLGGVGASGYVKNHSDQIHGLILWASYPSSLNDLSLLELPVLSIFATLDGKTTLEHIEDNKIYLPKHTDYFSIEGGNHTQFGYYGNGSPQSGDNQAHIDRQSQQELIIYKTLNFIQTFDSFDLSVK